MRVLQYSLFTLKIIFHIKTPLLYLFKLEAVFLAKASALQKLSVWQHFHSLLLLSIRAITFQTECKPSQNII